MNKQTGKTVSSGILLFCVFVMLITLLLATGCTVKETEEESTIVKTVSVDDGDYEPAFPLGISKVDLMSDGTVIIHSYAAVAEKVGKIYTVFDDCRDIFCYNYGNGGYRVILAIKRDGTISAISGQTLIERRRLRLKHNLGSFTDVKTIEQYLDDSAFGILVKFKDGSEKFLDEYLNF